MTSNWMRVINFVYNIGIFFSKFSLHDEYIYIYISTVLIGNILKILMLTKKPFMGYIKKLCTYY